jgi:signal transduction histidine kinase/DNA-binding response OmpR family regulator
MFNPAGITGNNYIPPVVFTDFQLFNQSVQAGEEVNGHVILPHSISEASEITLNYDENVFSIEFSALGFDNTDKSKYLFKLDGFDKQWLVARAKSRRATYTNLDPGSYTFTVKASNENGLWRDAGASINIIVLPPFWKTTWAYLFYLSIVLAILFFARKMIIARARARFAIEEERKQANRLHELDMMKIKFFTNVSHEFRTPLSLILTPLDRMIMHVHEPEYKKQLQMIQRNGRRLLNLVNQLLDFRKMEVQELRLNLQQGNLARFIREVCYSFTDLAEKKNIEFCFTCNRENFITQFDPDKLERILFNLLSNAFKFTFENGHVGVVINIAANGGKTFVEIKIEDDGIGIPKEKHQKIFERFFQNDVPGTFLNQGSGIGLSITKEFVRLYNGTITLESDAGAGACFTVLLPFEEIKEPVNGVAIKLAGPASAAENEAAAMPEEEFNNGRAHLQNKLPKKDAPVLLLVEDNEDFLFYLKDNLREYFKIIEACNGKKGWQKVLSEHPDIVVSDVSMPVMDGIELCRKIKTDARTKHIPVILLTALAGDETHVLGLEAGANDYITKPFNFEIMLSRIRNILSGQKSLKKVLGKQVEVKPSEVIEESQDEKFIQKVLAIVEKNLSNPDFSVEELSRDLYMSRVTVYKKLFALTGKSPIDFIRSIRLQRAAKLLEGGNLTIAEIAYEVGFNNPKYFSKFFKAELNIPPSKYAAEKKT